MPKYVIRSESGFFTLTSTEQDNYGQEIKHDTYEEAERVLEDMKRTFPFETFLIKEV